MTVHDLPAVNATLNAISGMRCVMPRAAFYAMPQVDLPRYLPPRGVPENVLAVDTPENMRRVNEAVKRGMKAGGMEWYNTMPLREGWIGEVGSPAPYNRFMEYTGGVSPRSRPPQNVRTASYYNMLDEFGLPQPQPVLREIVAEQVLGRAHFRADRLEIRRPFHQPP